MEVLTLENLLLGRLGTVGTVGSLGRVHLFFIRNSFQFSSVDMQWLYLQKS